MARGKTKETKTETIEIPKKVPTHIEVELSDNFSNLSSVIMKHQSIDFINGKAKVSQETAKNLKEQGFVK